MKYSIFTIIFEVIENPKNDKLYLIMEYMELGSLLSPTFYSKKSLTEMPILFNDNNNQKTDPIDKETIRNLFV
jgi:hypothetical protein